MEKILGSIAVDVCYEITNIFWSGNQIYAVRQRKRVERRKMSILQFMRRIFILILITLLTGIPTKGISQEIRGIYINSSDKILGDEAQEVQLLEYLIQGNFNSITFYSFHKLDFREPEQREVLRNFIRRGKSKYGLNRIGAASESLNGFMNIHHYNQDTLTLPEDRLDHYNLEFEFWSNSATAGYYCSKYLQSNGYPCTPDGAFSFVSLLLKNLRIQILDIPNIEIEVYVGWLKEDHAAVLSRLADRILFAVYKDMESDGSIELYDFRKQRERLESFGASGGIKVAPIFSSYDGSTDESLNTWLKKGHSPCEAWQQYAGSYFGDTSLLNRNNIHIDGYQWFKYTSMPILPVDLRIPGPIMGPKKVKQNQIVSYVIPPTNGALKYEWQIYPKGNNYYHSAKETQLKIKFPRSGNVTLMVRALGCGKLSPFARIDIEVEGVFPDVEVNSIDANNGIEVNIQNNMLKIELPDDLEGPFLVQIINSLGRKILTRSFKHGGEYSLSLNFLQKYPQILHVSILHPQDSFSKKFSILGL